LRGEYKFQDELDWIIQNKKLINLKNCSSGQQELLPMLTSIVAFCFSMYGFDKKSNPFFFIEEPEAHLFPSSQKNILAFFSLIHNTFDKQPKFFITTHSPYILTATNNLIQAANTSLEKKGNEKEVNK